jgi:hypothetical protein
VNSIIGTDSEEYAAELVSGICENGVGSLHWRANPPRVHEATPFSDTIFPVSVPYPGCGGGRRLGHRFDPEALWPNCSDILTLMMLVGFCDGFETMAFTTGIIPC